MRSESVLILLAVFMAFTGGLVLAEDAQSAIPTAIDANATNETNVTTVAAPQEIVSKYTQLSNATPAKTEVLGKELVKGYSDVSKTADTSAIFTREAGATTPSVKVAITKVNAAEDKWVEVTNQAVGSWDMKGWTLASGRNATFTFPDFTLDTGLSVKIHEGNGAGNDANLYTNSTAPLWIDNEVSLLNAEGTTISMYNISAAPTQTGYVDPLARQIQY